jgi:hypothetical protein
MKINGTAARLMGLVVRSHGVFYTSMSIVGVVHCDVTVVVAHLRRRDGRCGRVGTTNRSRSWRSRMNGGATVELVVFVSALRRGLVGIISRSLVVTVVTSRRARRVCGRILLPLGIHGADWLLLL